MCPAGHTFDIAAKGYVNLLMSNSSGAKRHGDDRLMINARRDFLSKGFYEPLREALYEALSAEFPRGGTLLDAGCGECWYTSYFKRRLDEAGLSRMCSAWISPNMRSRKHRKAVESTRGCEHI